MVQLEVRRWLERKKEQGGSVLTVDWIKGTMSLVSWSPRQHGSRALPPFPELCPDFLTAMGEGQYQRLCLNEETGVHLKSGSHLKVLI